MAWSILIAKNINLFDNVWVSTEDKEIYDIARNFGAKVISRPNNLAMDNISLELVCEHALSVIKDNYATDIFVMLPTSPFRRIKSMLFAWNIMITQNITPDSVISLKKIEHPVQWCLKLKGDGLCYPLDPVGYDMERQNLEEYYRHDGSVFISNISRFKETKKLLGDRSIGFVLQGLETLDIDEEIDMLFAEFCIKTNVINKQYLEAL